MELSFCDLRAKEVVNICDGRKLGNIIDLIIDCRCARVVGIVVPFDKGFFSFFKSKQDIFIPWHQICQIGRDVILVDISPAQLPEICSTKRNKNTHINSLNTATGQNSVINLGYSQIGNQQNNPNNNQQNNNLTNLNNQQNQNHLNHNNFNNLSINNFESKHANSSFQNPYYNNQNHQQNTQQPNNETTLNYNNFTKN